MPSKAQIDANRANAQLSTGPVTPDGKSKVSLNAVKTGLTGRTVLLPGDDAQAYETHVAGFLDQWQPRGVAEESLVHSLASTEWRLLRIPTLEHGIYALGRLKNADAFAHIADEASRHSLIDTETFLAHTRQLANLSTQENRLRRQREKDTAALMALQKTRQLEEKRQRLEQKARDYILCVKRQQDFTPRDVGFEFSMEQIENRALDIEPDLFAGWAAEQEAERAAEQGAERAAEQELEQEPKEDKQAA